MEHNIVPSQAEEIQHLSVFATPKFSLDDENLTLSDVEDYYDDINDAEEEETVELRAGDVVVFYRMAAHGVPDQGHKLLPSKHIMMRMMTSKHMLV